MKTTIDKLAHKYALNIKQIRGPGPTKIADFKNLNKNFYDDIESNNITIRDNTKLLNKIKTNSLKEFIYTNKEIPDLWKNKINYQDELLGVITTDKKLLSYIGSNSMKVKKYSLDKFPKINTRYNLSKSLRNKYLENNESQKEKNPTNTLHESNNINNSAMGSSIKKKYSFLNNDKISEKEINALMDDYKAAYPIKEKLNELYITSNYYNKNKNETYYNDLNELNSNEENKLISTKKSYNSISSTNRLMTKRVFIHTNKKIMNKKQKTFRQNIFNNLSPPIDNTFYSFNKEKLKKINISNKLFNIIQNKTNKNSDISKLSEITNPIIKRNIESINYYGPYFSFCPSCRSKNMEYYNNMEPKQCLEIIHLIKKVRNNNDILNIRRTSSVSPIKKSVAQKDTLESEKGINDKEYLTENEKADKFV